MLHELTIPTVAKWTGSRSAPAGTWHWAATWWCPPRPPGFPDLCPAARCPWTSGALAAAQAGRHAAGQRLALLAEIIGAEEAKSLGLVTYLVAAEEIDAFVTDLANRLAAGPPVALAQKQGAAQRERRPLLRDALASEARRAVDNFATEDTPVAFQAFVDKTDPTFTASERPLEGRRTVGKAYVRMREQTWQCYCSAWLARCGRPARPVRAAAQSRDIDIDANQDSRDQNMNHVDLGAGCSSPAPVSAVVGC